MKGIVSSCVVAGFMFFSSCTDYIDVDKYFTDMLSVDSAFSKRAYVEGWLSNAWEHLYREVSDIGSNSSGNNSDGYVLFASDDLVSNNEDGKKYQIGGYSPTEHLHENKLYRTYEPIRKASTFILNVDKCGELSMREIAEMKAQARFLRAYCYWVMMRQYGPIPLIPEEGLNVSMSYEELSLPRAHYDDLVEFLAKDFLQAAQNLRVGPWPSNNIGRPTRGAALAARAKLFLYAASPLYNGNTDFFNVKGKDGQVLVAQTYDEGKWARAAAAVKEVILLSQNNNDLYRLYTVPRDTETPSSELPPEHAVYSYRDFPDGWADIDPFKSYRNLFNGSVYASKNTELIFHRPNHTCIPNLVQMCVPKYLQGYGIVGVTERMVNAYYMNDGRTISEASDQDLDGDGYPDYRETGFTTSASEYGFLPKDVALRYANREPRFYASIAYNGSIWECESTTDAKFRGQQIFYYYRANGGKQSFTSNDFPPTGTGVKKYYNPEDAFTTGGYRVPKYEQAIRYADVLLWYAEALNELTSGSEYTFEGYDGTSITVRRDVNEIRWAMKQIRMRAGLPDFSDEVYNDPDKFREVLKKERQIEFFAENSRYYDLRRWKDALEKENSTLMGCDTNVQSGASVRENYYKSTALTDFPKIFLQKMYLWPFPSSELTKNVNLTQNPGW